MIKKITKVFGRLFVVFAVALAAVIICSGVGVHADNGDTVRVSTAKELKSAIKNANVGTIIFKTDAFLNVTIKADKKAKGKSLIIDAENSIITNKAVFADIDIRSAKQYTESVSGNNISLSDSYIPEGIIVSKKKKVKSFTVYSSQGIFWNNFTLRNGAKISAYELIFSGDEIPVKSSYNKSKKQVTIKCSYDGCDRSYTIKLDKNGRITSLDCESNWPEADYNESYTYDSNGNLLKSYGSENTSGNYSTEVTYSGNQRMKSVYKSEYESGEYTFTYDKKGNLVHEEYIGVGSIDGESFDFATVTDYEYDKNGRLTYERWEDSASGYFVETSYTYDSKGFQTEQIINSSGSESVYKFKFNKAGDMIEKTYSCEGYKETTTYEYDKLGNPIGEEYN